MYQLAWYIYFFTYDISIYMNTANRYFVDKYNVLKIYHKCLNISVIYGAMDSFNFSSFFLEIVFPSYINREFLTII